MIIVLIIDSIILIIDVIVFDPIIDLILFRFGFSVEDLGVRFQALRFRGCGWCRGSEGGNAKGFEASGAGVSVQGLRFRDQGSDSRTKRARAWKCAAVPWRARI